jgi:hypothetical protein
VLATHLDPPLVDLRGVVQSDLDISDDERRPMIYQGAVFLFPSVPEVAAFATFARQRIEEAFAPYDPLTVHEVMTDHELAEILLDFKPRFIHDPESKWHVQQILTALGADPTQTYFDVPKLRSSYPAGHLNTGIAYAFQPHRDTWYAAPPQQINYWLPVFSAGPDNAMLFYPEFHAGGVTNNSSDYNYYEFNAWRGKMKEQSGGKDTRVHPAPAPGVDLGATMTVLPPVGGVMAFSADQLHASIPNVSAVARYSIDFRAVNRADVEDHRGSACGDVACEGTAMRDFMRVTDLERLPDELVAEYDTESAVEYGVTPFEPGLR